MPTTFPNIDFKFRRGTLDGYKTTAYMEGSLNFVKDDESLYIHKDGLKFRISDIILDAGTEDAIRSITLPKLKLYYASDTHRLLWFDRENLKWVYVSSDIADFAEKARKDINGNDINEYYYPRTEAVSDYRTLNDLVTAITEDLSLIVQFDTEICSSISDLPEIGKKGTIYLVPKMSYYGWEELPEEEDDMDTHVELIYVVSEEYGNFYEVIGSTNVNLNEFYTKNQVDNLLDGLEVDFEDRFNDYKAEVNASINGFRTILNSTISVMNNRFNAIDNTLASMANSLADHQSRIAALETKVAALEAEVGINSSATNTLRSRVSTLETGLGNLSITVATNKQQTDATIASNYNTLNSSISTVNTNLNTLINRVTGDESRIDNHTTRLGTVEADIDNHETRISTIETTIEDIASGSDVSALAARVSTAENNISNHETRITDLEDESLTFAKQTAVNDINTRLTVTEGSVSNHESRITQLESDMALTALDSDLDTLIARVAGDETTISSNTSRINAIEVTLRTVATTSDISRVDDRVDYVEDYYAIAEQGNEDNKT